MSVAHSPAPHAASARTPRRRSLLSVVIAAGVAIAGLMSAAPAAAEEPPVTSLEIEVDDCAEYGGQGNLHYVVRDPYTFYQDFITVWDASDQIVHEAVYIDDTEFESDVALDPGEYTIIYTVERETGGANIDRQAFTIGACPDLDPTVGTVTCSTGDDGAAVIGLTGLVPGEDYRWDFSGEGISRVGTLTAESEAVDVPFDDLAPGNYVLYIEWRPDLEAPALAVPAPVFDWVIVVVPPCQPTAEVAVDTCTAASGAEATVSLGGLVAGVDYDVRVTRSGQVVHESTVTGGPQGTASISLSGLDADTTYLVTVDGLFVAGPWEEPPYIGSGGGTAVIDEVALSAEARVTTAAPCPPGQTPGRELAATGTDGAAGLLPAALLLVVAGVVALVARRVTGPHPD